MPHGSAHNSLPVDVIYPRDINQGEAPVSPNDSRYAWHFLAEGDSWFTLAAIPSSSLLLELRLAKWTQILNIAYPGDTLKHIGELANNADLHTFLAKPNFNYAWDALVLSGGGNDVIDAAPELIRKQPIDGSDPSLPESYVDAAALSVLLAVIQQGFNDIVALRDSAGSKSIGRPAFVHTYDYSTPRNAPSRFIGLIPIRGPWLFKAFAGSSIDIAMQQQIANHLVDSLAGALLELDSDNAASGKALPSFHVIDTRDSLIMANPVDVGTSNDWLNEIHPNLTGYRKIASRISTRINEVLLG